MHVRGRENEYRISPDEQTDGDDGHGGCWLCIGQISCSGIQGQRCAIKADGLSPSTMFDLPLSADRPDTGEIEWVPLCADTGNYDIHLLDRCAGIF